MDYMKFFKGFSWCIIRGRNVIFFSDRKEWFYNILKRESSNIPLFTWSEFETPMGKMTEISFQ